MTAENFFVIVANKKSIIFLNLCIWYLLYMIVFAISNHVKFTIILLNTITYFFAVANAFVIQFRDQPIMPMDIKSISTVITVAGEFQYDPTGNMILMGLLVLLCNLWIHKVDFSFSDRKKRILYLVLTVGCSFFCFYGMFVGDFFKRAGVAEMDFFRFKNTYQTDGYMVPTMRNIRFLHVKKTQNYSIDKVNEIVSGVHGEEETKKKLPENVIVIMNESFADLSVLGSFETSEPVLPYLDSLKDSSKQGYVYVSAHGGGTANSEFEFLTGNSVSNIPIGTIAYQMYVDEGDASIVSLFKENGYRTVAWHPYFKGNYNRPAVYEIYGFDDYYGWDEIECEEIRNFSSDRSDYQAIIDLYKNKSNSEKMFLFNVTMQNHGGYDNENYESTISLTDCPGNFPQAEQYLSLVHESDAALQELVDYFSAVEEKTVILLFGDHQPYVEEEFYGYVMGTATEENLLETVQRKMMTPYVLWANYDLDIEEEDYISANYLGSYLLKAIEMELPEYNQYLLELQEKIPAININGFLDENKVMHELGENDEYEELLNEYQILQYNNLFDNKHRVDEIFELQK